MKTWELMQELPKTGKTRAVGVSNFSINNLKKVLSSPGNKVVPAVNQVEIHPLLPQEELLEWCHSKGILLEAYSPLGSTNAPILTEPVLINLAKKHGVQTAQIVISWHVQRGYIVLPKSVHAERIQANFKTLKLSDEEMREINNISKEKGERRIVQPHWEPFVPFV